MVSAHFHKTSWAEWVEWKKKCAIDLCSEPSRESLVLFVGPQLIKKYHEVCPGRTLPLIDTRKEKGGARTGFHFFETYMHSVSSGTGKRWKDWLFQRAAMNTENSPEVAIEKEVSTCLNNAVLRRMTEGEEDDATAARSKGENVISINAPTGEERTYEDILNDLATPNPADEAALNELITIGRSEAAIHLGKIPRYQRIAVLASALNLSLGMPEVTTAAGKGKSALYDSVNLPKQEQRQMGRSFCSRFWQDFRRRIESQYPNEDRRTLDLLSDAFVQELGNAAIEWGKSEKSLAPLFSLGEDLPAS